MPGLTSVTSLGLKLSVLRVGQWVSPWRLELRQRLIPWQRPLSLRGLPRRQQGLGGSCHDATRMPGKSSESSWCACENMAGESQEGGQGQGPSRNHFFRLHGQCGRLDEGRRTRLRMWYSTIIYAYSDVGISVKDEIQRILAQINFHVQIFFFTSSSPTTSAQLSDCDRSISV